MLTLNFAIANARLVTLAPGLRPELRFAPVARGLNENENSNRMKNFGIVLITRQTRFKQAVNYMFLCKSASKIYYKAPTSH